MDHQNCISRQQNKMKTVILAKEHTAYLAAKLAIKLDSVASDCRLLYFSYAELYYEFPSLSAVKIIYPKVDHLLLLSDFENYLNFFF